MLGTAGSTVGALTYFRPSVCAQELEDFLPQKQPQVNEAETGLAYQERQDYSLL